MASSSITKPMKKLFIKNKTKEITEMRLERRLRDKTNSNFAKNKTYLKNVKK